MAPLISRVLLPRFLRTTCRLCAIAIAGLIVLSGAQASAQSVWVLAPSGLLDRMNESGTTLDSGVGTSGSTSSQGGLAADSSSDIWSVSSANNALHFVKYDGTGAATFTGGGLNAPTAVAVDGLGKVWVTNTSGNSVSLFTNSGTVVSPSTGFETAYSAPSGIAIDISGDVWVTNSGNNTVTEIIGAAAPVAPPSTALTNSTTGERP